MDPNQFSRRVLLRNSAFIGGGLVLSVGCTTGQNQQGNTSELASIEGGEVVTDPARFPASYRESPELAKQVAEGKLPPVAERIGQAPLVIKPVHGIGRYGGQIRRGYTDASDLPTANRFCSGPDNLLYWDFRQEKVVPNIARDYELSPDFRELVLHLRPGMKWSDGHPFTADDILFWRNDINLDRSLGTGASALRVHGEDVLIEKIDDVTVRFRSPAPYAMLPEVLASNNDIGGQTLVGRLGGGGFAPQHYLSRFHRKYTSEAEVNALARAAGHPNWARLLLNRNTWHLNPELPALTPWIVTRPINDPPFEFSANPYSIWVDTEGNQLPYIPTITMSQAKDPEIINLRTASGDFDFQDRSLHVAKLPVLVRNQQRGNYTVYRAPSDSMDCVVRFNLAYDKDPEIGELIRTVEFRRALSLGVDRDQINQTFFLGSSVPSATMPAESSPHHPGAEWRLRWATHDIAQANQLLDGIGLTRKDPDGFRLRSSGGDRLRLNIQSGASVVDNPGIGEMIRKQWAQIGIEATSQTVDAALLIERALSGEIMLNINALPTDDPFTFPDSGFLPTVTNDFRGMIGIPYAKWFFSGGREGTEPPASVTLLKEAMDLYWRGLEVDRAARAPLGQQLFRMHADQVWSIGVAGFGLAATGIYCAKNNLGNVPARVRNNVTQKSTCNALPMTFYYKD